MAQLTLRKAQEKDVDTLVTFGTHAMQQTFGTIFSQQQMAQWMAPEALGRSIEETLPDTTLAEWDGKVIGAIAANEKGIAYLWTAKEFEGRGIERMLLTRLESEMMNRGKHHLKYECFADLKDKTEFLEDQGYLKTKESIDPVFGIAKATFEKSLGL
ncbi:GNAT family N-acetyltransferase [Pontibacter sp. G13]|uniref:GNAT family N-acetyltransferase n=1 Tax=Pontibacter sp. G13 TaxID=3074898 RepID=UPI002889B5E6|nr:GNAT family N-acetyltransferase [Pontibacter sp. G13]WNJ20171.1 GNAT family N-acetyltransferase [Pontibacter sp. G13]